MKEMIKSFIKKQFIDVLEWQETDDETIVYQFPMQDQEIQNGGKLTVRESQMAVFVNEGVIADVFGPGLHTLNTNTLPLLTNLKNWDKLFASPFKSDVYFVSTRHRIGRPWGTPQPVTVRDSEFGMIQIRANGQYAWRIEDPAAFFRKVSGTIANYTAAKLEQQLRGAIVQSIATGIGSSGKPFIDLAAHQSDLAEVVRVAAAQAFAKLGLQIEDLQIVSLSLPDAVQQSLDVRMKMGIIGDTRKYAELQAADAMLAAAKNEGGGVAAMGAQMAVGVAMGGQMANALAGQGQAAAPAALPAGAAPAPQGPLARLENAKGLLDKGLIAQADYDDLKAKILAQLAAG